MMLKLLQVADADVSAAGKAAQLPDITSTESKEQKQKRNISATHAVIQRAVQPKYDY